MSSGNDRENLIEMPEEIGTEEAKAIEKTGIMLDLRGEVCPYPQIKAKESLTSATSGQVVIVYTDHVDALMTVPAAVKNLVSRVSVWKSGRGEYKIFLWRK